MTEKQIRDQVSRYLAGVISVEELEHALPDAWLLDESANTALRDLTLRVLGHVSEFIAGEVPEPEFRTRLKPFASWLLTLSYSAEGLDIVGATRPQTEVFAAGTSPLEVPA
jgi:hypothetical protein